MSASLPSLRFSHFDQYRDVVEHAVFTREGGVSAAPFQTLNVSYSVGDLPEAVMENRARCLATLDLTLDQLTTAGLVHGVAVADAATAAAHRQRDGSNLIQGVDALSTTQPGSGLMITSADCLQVLFFDPQRRAIAIAHAGWRGLVAGVLGATVRRLQQSYRSNAETVLVGIGPGLGPCCARFSDPARELPAHVQRYVQQQHLDLWALAHDQLRDAGIRGEHIEHQAICTVCQRQRFFSHRGDKGRTGRFAAMISLRA